ncbi:MAG: sugar transporter, partial [Paramuribaculum sp.]|nr:sugar transporter [Paramuribaculum sp.]
MDSNSRTAKSIKNSSIALTFYVCSLLLQFFSRRILIEVLGDEILGLNSTILNILQFLNLAELGISSAVGFTLYRPLHTKDYQTICEVVTLQGYLYRKIAIIIIIGSIIVCALFPYIFAKISLPLWYAYASFAVLLLSALLGYFVNYKQIVLTASQQDYKIIYSYRSIMLLKIIAQMAAVYYLKYPYVWWLILEAVFSIIGSLSLYITTKRTFPFLKDVDRSFASLRSQYNEFTKKIKQLFVHKIGRFALTQSAPLIIYAYTNLTLVTYYSNYLVITNGVIILVSATFNSMTAGIGNLVAQGDTSKNLSFFFELFNLRFLIISTICFTLFYIIPGFINVWLGQEYNLPTTTLLLIISSLYITLSRMTVDAYIDVYGIFQDIYAPIIETILNIGLSVLLGYLYELNGILSEVLISQ